MDTHELQKNINVLPWFVFLILTRLLPHPPNTAPIFCAVLALSYFLPRNQITLIGLGAFMFSDIILAFINHYPVFGWWSFFTYSGFVAAFFLGTTFFQSASSSLLRACCAVVTSTFFFWVWTNLGTWLTTALYPKTFTGLVACFIAGIPFLSNSMLGNFAFGVVIFVPLLFSKRKLAKLQGKLMCA